MDAKQFKVTFVGNGGGNDVTATPSDRNVIRLACSFYRSPTAASKAGGVRRPWEGEFDFFMASGDSSAQSNLFHFFCSLGFDVTVTPVVHIVRN